MGKKRLVTEGIRIGDIFDCYSYTWLGVHGYYEVTAFRGRTLAVLREVKTERYINRGISEDSALYWRRERVRPLPGQFLEPPDDDPYVGNMLTAWVECWYKDAQGWDRCRLRGYGKHKDFFLDLAYPEDWAEWTPEEIKALEEAERAGREGGADR